MSVKCSTGVIASIAGIIWGASVLHCTAQMSPHENLRSRTVVLSANVAGLPGYVGAASFDCDLQFGDWVGVRAGWGTSYNTYEGDAKGYAFAAKLTTLPRAADGGRSERVEVVVGACYMRVSPHDGTADFYAWQLSAGIGLLVELTDKNAPIAIVGRLGLGYFYYYGAPFYIGYGMAF